MQDPLPLPAGLVAYRQTPVFDETTIPSGLLREHRTRPGTWGVITILEGRLRFRMLDPPSETILSPERRGIVAPQQPHEVAPDGPVKFFIVFCHALTPAGSGAPDGVIPGPAAPPRNDAEEI